MGTLRTRQQQIELAGWHSFSRFQSSQVLAEVSRFRVVSRVALNRSLPVVYRHQLQVHIGLLTELRQARGRSSKTAEKVCGPYKSFRHGAPVKRELLRRCRR